MKLYRVITQNLNYQDILVYLIEHKLDATIIQANGLWQGRAEKSIVIEIVDDRFDTESYPHEGIKGFVYWLKKHNKQDKVMLQTIDAGVKLM